ncbi:MAG: hypothetical protein C0592_03465 [Marinilabiliales bacterium]|nr:MAG: hypothetical protein C0592_03465 [Marinilabiliales bacterium]
MQFNTEPQNQDFHIDGIRHVLPVDAYSVNEDPDFLFLDVREEFELVLALIDVQKFECCSLSVILEKLECLSKDQSIIVLSNKGERSCKVANLLSVQGFTDVYNLDGGIKAWAEAGLPMKSCSSEQCGSCSCGCES